MLVIKVGGSYFIVGKGEIIWFFYCGIFGLVYIWRNRWIFWYFVKEKVLIYNISYVLKIGFLCKVCKLLGVTF